MSVSAVDEADRIAQFSSFGPEVDVGWYGTKILSFGRNGGYAVMSGTSMACPLLPGLYALLVQREVKQFGSRKTKTLDGVMAWLARSCTDAGAPGRDDQFGLGIPNAMEALNGAAIPPPAGPGQEFKIDLGPMGIVTFHVPPRVTDKVSVDY